MSHRTLGRLTPPDWTHVEKHPLTAGLVTEPRAAVLGINWYEGFDNPVKGTDGRFRIRISGGIRGGHAICADCFSPDEQDAWPFHVFYNQGETEACTGFSTSRTLTLAYRKFFDAFWLYDDARRLDGTFDNPHAGSYVRSAFAAAKKWGDHYASGSVATPMRWTPNSPGVEIKGYQWATSAEQLRGVLGFDASVGEIPLLNSWGTYYPESVYIDLADIDTLLKQEGEAGCPIL